MAHTASGQHTLLSATKYKAAGFLHLDLALPYDYLARKPRGKVATRGMGIIHTLRLVYNKRAVPVKAEDCLDAFKEQESEDLPHLLLPRDNSL